MASMQPRMDLLKFGLPTPYPLPTPVSLTPPWVKYIYKQPDVYVSPSLSSCSREVRLKKALTRKFGKQGAKEIRNKSKNVASAFFADVTVQRPSLAPRYASG